MGTHPETMTLSHFSCQTKEVMKAMDKKEIFADGMKQISFSGGMIRFDLMTLQPNENGEAPTKEVSGRVIMPPHGFLAMFNSMQSLINKLLDAGVLKKNEPQTK